MIKFIFNNHLHNKEIIFGKFHPIPPPEKKSESNISVKLIKPQSPETSNMLNSP